MPADGMTRYRLHGYETTVSHSEPTEKETPGLWRQQINAEEVLDQS